MAGCRRNQPSYESIDSMKEVFYELLREIRGNRASGSTGNSGSDTNENRYLDFLMYNPPTFHGEYDPKTAENWLLEMEKVFELMECAGENKVGYATSLLKDEAKHWWRASKDRLTSENPGHIDWLLFRDVFLEKYFPDDVRDQKEAEFLLLRQGGMTVAQYVAKFDELSRYSSRLLHQPNDLWKCKKFERGLKPELKHMLIAFEIRDYARLVNKCLVLEQISQELEIARQTNWKRKRDAYQDKKTRKPLVESFKRSQTGHAPLTVPLCQFCEKKHLGICLHGSGVCFKCRKSGHMVKDCQVESRRLTQVGGRVYIQSRKVVEETNELIQSRDELEQGDRVDADLTR